MTQTRIAKVLAAAGIASRRAAEQLIFEGRVTVNGAVLEEPGVKVDPAVDAIAVDGKPIPATEKKLYFILNKPMGYFCSSKRRTTEDLVIDLFSKHPERLFTVGRLDRDTTGLLIVTNDGDFANQVIHPSSNVAKEYIVQTQEPVDGFSLRRMRDGCEVEGVFVKPISVEKIKHNSVKVVVMEGKKREVRIIVKAAGLTVLALKRTAIGGLRMEGLREGEYRPMTDADKRTIFSS